MGIALGIDRIAPYAKLLGLGEKTGIKMEHEVSGLIPTSEWKLKRLGEEWQPGENLSNAIGQGFVLATPLQMAVAYNAIGLDGKVVKPYLVKKILNQDSEVVQEFHPQIMRDATQPNEFGVVLSKQYFKPVRHGMRMVVEGEEGTARNVRVPGVEIAGKTGTSQVRSFSADDIYKPCHTRRYQNRHHGWFVAFAPAERPEITIAVMTQHSCSGAWGSGSVAHDVIQAYFEKYHPELMKAALEKEKTRKGRHQVPSSMPISAQEDPE
jgi:penicillin-binding protein 2